ncbi:MAG: YbaB/EbfC family nucleoid-associated protein [Bacteroidia bacterium]|nr:YbaB/EbfC family nucleoid-associated protein [Bacteroidia bacterium]MDW8235175.1 YbaB/EbfC family nucleoid-associated protein [Bacteroidia bacterium]
MWDFLKALQKVQELAQELEHIEVAGSSSDGKVQIILTGHQMMRSIRFLAPDILQDSSKLEEAILQAYHDAREKLQQTLMEKLGGQLPPNFLPGSIGIG